MRVAENVCLETERLILRPWQKEDLEDFFAYAKVDGVGEMAGWRHHDSIEVSAKILDGFIKERNDLAIVLKKTGRVIGSFGVDFCASNVISFCRKETAVEIGYVLSKEHWGKGLMGEACKEMIRFLFAEKQVDAIVVGHFEENRQSLRVIEKCGFEYAGCDSEYCEAIEKEVNKLTYLLCNPSKEVFFIKPMQDRDIQGKAHVHFKAWHQTYTGLMDQSYLDQITEAKCLQLALRYPQNTLVVKRNHTVVGFGSYGICQDEDLSNCGEIISCYLLDEVKGKGLGRKLIEAMEARLKKEDIAIWCLDKNEHALGFYHHCGYFEDGIKKAEKMNCQTILKEVRLRKERKKI